MILNVENYPIGCCNLLSSADLIPIPLGSGDGDKGSKSSVRKRHCAARQNAEIVDSVDVGSSCEEGWPGQPNFVCQYTQISLMIEKKKWSEKAASCGRVTRRIQETAGLAWGGAVKRVALARQFLSLIFDRRETTLLPLNE